MATTEELLIQINGQLGELRGDVKSLVSSVNQHIADDKLVEGRVRDLEGFKNRQIGAMSIVGMVCSAIGSVITILIEYFWRK